MAKLLFIQLLHMHSSILLRGWMIMTLLLSVNGVLGWMISPVHVGSFNSAAPRCRRRSARYHCDDTAPLENHNNVLGDWDRRDFLQTVTLSSVAAAAMLFRTTAAGAAPVPTLPHRLVDVGEGGIDISIDTKSKILSDPSNLVFPASLEGRWSCLRTCLSVDGDAYQAQSAWKAMLGGGNNNNAQFFGANAVPEQYEIQFIPAPFQPEKYTVLDRSYELKSRTSGSGDGSGMIDKKSSIQQPIVQWNAQEPNIARVDNTELAVIQRSVIVPNLEQGIVAGGQELIRISEDGGPIVRAVLVKQRFRSAAASSAESPQNSSISVLEGLELVQTFRVLDGVAGTEFPTSTTKYMLKLVKLGPLVNSTTAKDDDDSTTKLVSSSSMYFDGSAWYENSN